MLLTNKRQAWGDIEAFIWWIAQGSPVPARFRNKEWAVVFYWDGFCVTVDSECNAVRQAIKCFDTLVKFYDYSPKKAVYGVNMDLETAGGAAGPRYLRVFPLVGGHREAAVRRYLRKADQLGHAITGDRFVADYGLTGPMPPHVRVGGLSSTPPYDYAELFPDE